VSRVDPLVFHAVPARTVPTELTSWEGGWDLCTAVYYGFLELAAADRKGGGRHIIMIYHRMVIFDADSVADPNIRIRIRIHRTHMFLGLLDPDPLVRGMDPDPDPALDPDPDPSKYSKKNLDFYCFVTSF
jgi:hypothetical protein